MDSTLEEPEPDPDVWGICICITDNERTEYSLKGVHYILTPHLTRLYVYSLTSFGFLTSLSDHYVIYMFYCFLCVFVSADKYRKQGELWSRETVSNQVWIIL